MSHGPEHDARMRADLAALGAPPMPAEVGTRIGAALAQAQRDLDRTPGRTVPEPDPVPRACGAAAGPDPGPGAAPRSGTERRTLHLVDDPAGGRPTARGAGLTGRRGRGRAHPAALAGLVAAAVVAVAAVVVTVGAPAAPRVASEESELRDAGVGAVGERGAGALADPVRRRGCLAAAGVPGPASSLLGGRPYTVRGQPGTLLVLGDPVRGRFRLVVVDPGCGPAGGRLLAAATVGR